MATAPVAPTPTRRPPPHWSIVQRPSATTLLLAGAALARAAAVGLTAGGGDLGPLTAVLVVDVVVPAAIATADHRGRPGAATAAVAYGALGAATLMANGLVALDGTVPLSSALVAFLAASALAMLAGATAIGRWQDHGAPAGGPGPRWLRATAVLAATGLALVLVTEDVAVVGAVAVPGGVLPGPVAVATTVTLRRLPLLVGALLPMAWAATRAGTGHLRAVALVLGARAVVEATADASLLSLGAPLWPFVVGAAAAGILLVLVPVGAQVTSSRA